MDDLHELLATGACARIGGGDDAHSSRTSRSSRLARAQEARITARLHGRRPAGSAREQHGSQLVGRGCAFATCAIPDLIQNAQLARNFPGEENTLTSSKCVYCKEEAASIGSSGLCKSEGRHCSELHPSIFIFFDRGYNFHRNISRMLPRIAKIYWGKSEHGFGGNRSVIPARVRLRVALGCEAPPP